MASAKSSTKGEYHVAGKYRLVRKIGSGSFGDIYLAMNIANGEVGILLKHDSILPLNPWIHFPYSYFVCDQGFLCASSNVMVWGSLFVGGGC